MDRVRNQSRAHCDPVGSLAGGVVNPLDVESVVERAELSSVLSQSQSPGQMRSLRWLLSFYRHSVG